MQLENLGYFSNLCDSFRFNVIWHRPYVTIFGLMQFGTDNL